MRYDKLRSYVPGAKALQITMAKKNFDGQKGIIVSNKVVATVLGLSPEKVLKYSLASHLVAGNVNIALVKHSLGHRSKILGLLSQGTYHPIFWRPTTGWESLGRPPFCGRAGRRRHRYFRHWAPFSGPFPSSHPSTNWTTKWATKIARKNGLRTPHLGQRLGNCSNKSLDLSRLRLNTG